MCQNDRSYYVGITCPTHTAQLLRYVAQSHTLVCTICDFYIPLPDSWQWAARSLSRRDVVDWYGYIDHLRRKKTLEADYANLRRARKRLEKVLQRKKLQVVAVFVEQEQWVEVAGVDWCGGGCKPTTRIKRLVQIL